MSRLVATLLVALGLALISRANAASCSFSISAMNFNSVDTLSGTAQDVTATLTINCSNVISGFVRVCPHIGAGSGGSSGSTRQMRDGANDILAFNIFQDANRSVVWGSAEAPTIGNAPNFDFTTSVNGSVSATRTLYGRVLANQQSAAIGSYTSVFANTVAKVSYSELPLFSCLTLNAPVGAPFTVSASVQANCLISAQAISFGSQGVLRTNVDANGAVSITCTPGTAYTVALEGGKSATGPTARRMTLGGVVGAAYVTYGLYLNSGRTQAWSTGAGQVASGTGTGAAQPFTVYGRVPAQTTPAPGSYSDIIVATVTY